MIAKQRIWLTAGAALSLGTWACACLSGRRTLGRLSAGFAGAFLAAWRDARLEEKVAGILSRTGGTASDEAQAAAGRMRGNP